MKAFVSHTSALEFWRANWREGSKPTCSHVLPQSGTDPSRRWLKGLDFAQLGILNKPVHILISESGSRIQSLDVMSHRWDLGSSERLFVPVDEEIYVASPEACFLQMANTLPVPQLVLLGLEFCGTYRLHSTCQPGLDAAPPLMSPQSLRREIGRHEGERGCVRASKAADFIVEGSASPMESLLCAFLCLPTSLGGYSIELPCMNYQIKLQQRSSCCRGGESRFCDLYWPRARVALEYDSKAYHEDLGLESHDSARRTELGLEDVHVISVTKDQVNDVNRFDELAHLLAKELGKPLRIRRKDFRKRRAKLRKELWNVMYGGV